MIRIHRVLTFPEYVESNKIFWMNTNLLRKFNFVLWRYVMPVVGFVGLIFFIWKLNHLWTGTGNNASAFGIDCGLASLCIVFCIAPLTYRRSMRRIYLRQELDHAWTIEVTPQGIRSTIPGKADTHLEWAFFNRYVETSDLFTLLQLKRRIFVTIPKASLQPQEQAELKDLLNEHLPGSL